MKDSFIIYTSFYGPIKMLSDKQLGRLFRALFDYQIEGSTQVDADIQMAFAFFKNQMDIDEGKYQKVVQRNKQNGSKGGRPTREENPKNPMGLNKPKKTDNDNDNDLNLESTDVDSLSGSSPPDAPEKIDYKKFVDWFNSETKGVFGDLKYPISENRKGMMRARIKEHGKEVFLQVIQSAAKSNFLKGNNNRSWRATFDWMIKPVNFEKILSGNYGNRVSGLPLNEDDFINNLKNKQNES